MGRFAPAWRAALAGLLLVLLPVPFVMRRSTGIVALIARRTDSCRSLPSEHRLRVGRYGALTLDGRNALQHRLDAELEFSFGRDPERVLFVSADPDSVVGEVAGALDVAHAVADKIALVTAREDQAPGSCLYLPPPKGVFCGTQGPPPPDWVQPVSWWRL